MWQHYKTIVPLARGTEQDPDPSDSRQDREIPTKKRRTTAKVACNACRARRSACDCQRPRCIKCKEKNTECVYVSASANDTSRQSLKRQIEPLKRKVNEYEEFVNKLNLLPEEDALVLLRCLRSASDPSSLIRSLSGSMDGRQWPSDHRAARAMAPQADSTLEFEIMVRHPLIYPRLIPMDAASIKLSPAGESLLNKPDRSNLQLFSPADSSPGTGRQSPSCPGGPAPPQPRGNRAREGSPRAEEPREANQYCDARLHDLDISYWTRVPANNQYAAAAISMYLQADHAILGQFDADLFLTDLVEQRPRFCSPFLVSAFLYVVFQPYTKVDIKAAALKLAFFNEAESRWREERLSDTLLNVAAITTLSIGCTYHGKDALSKQLLAEGRQMAQRMGLLGINPEKNKWTVASFRQMQPELIRAASYVAWGVYSWLSLHSMFFPDDPVKHPPVLPIPGADHMKRGPSWPPHPLPAYIGQTFPSICELWTIAQQIAVEYFSHKDMSLSPQISLITAETKYQELLSWTDSLSPAMARTDRCPSHVLLFHMCYHCVALGIFRPFIRASEERAAQERERLPSFCSGDSSPNAVFDASVNQLKRLVFDYYFSYPQESYTAIFNVALVQLAYVSVKKDVDSDWRLYFLFCIRCWQDLYICYPIFLDTGQAYLSMALREGMLNTSEARSLVAELQQKGGHHEAIKELGTSCLADFDLAMISPDEATAHALAKKFDELAVLADLTYVPGQSSRFGFGREME